MYNIHENASGRLDALVYVVCGVERFVRFINGHFYWVF